MSENSEETNPDAKWSSETLPGGVQESKEESFTASKVTATDAGGSAFTHDGALEQYAGGRKEQADPLTVVTFEAPLVEYYRCPTTGNLWVSSSGMAWWHSDPSVRVSLDHTSGDGEQQPTSHTATLIAGTGGKPGPQSFGAVDDAFEC
jgi:hypothetical protein